MTEPSFVIHNGVLLQYLHREEVVIVPEGVHTIGPEAFKACISICRVILPSTLVTIREYAFKGCRQLQEINFPHGLKTIGKYAFHRCHSLKSVDLPDTVKELADCTFLYCDGLESVSIKGVVKLGGQCFLNDIQLRKLSLSPALDQNTICDVFTGCYRISEIAFSDGVLYKTSNILAYLLEENILNPILREIAVDVFRMMDLENGTVTKFRTNLRYVEIPEGVTAIGRSCFFNKKGIVGISLPKSLKRIESRAFRNCINLNQVQLQSADVIIDEDAFKNCTTLKEIVIEDQSYKLEGLPDYMTPGVVPVPLVIKQIHQQLLSNFLISGRTLLKYRGAEERVTVPDGITIIGEGAFAGNQYIDRVILPETVREIHPYAFAGCSLMQTINLPAQLSILGASAFENCMKLIRINLPETLEVLEPSVFNRCKKLREVQFGNNIVKISKMAFYSCEALNPVLLPPYLKEIGSLAFYKCRSLRQIILHSFIEKLGSNIFTASGIRKAEVYCTLLDYGTDIFSQCKKLREILFGEAITQIPDKFAYSCESLMIVQFSEKLENIGRQAFEFSPYFENAPAVLADQGIYLKGGNLSGDVVIEQGITAIAGGAFYQNKNITSVTLPDSVRFIGSRAFCGCSALKNILLPENVTVLEEGVFAYCESLEQVKISCKKQDGYQEKGFTMIKDNAFYGCGQLEEIPLFQTVYIGKSAFLNCINLKNVSLNDPFIQENAFKKTPVLSRALKTQGFSILGTMVLDGTSASGEVIIPEGIRAIGPYAFLDNEHITRVILPESLEYIGDGAFYACVNLQVVMAADKLCSIGEEAFARCISLKEISLECAQIGARSFANCVNLRKAVVNGVRSFPLELFYSCLALQECRGNKVAVINEGCFSDCDSLKTFDFSDINLIGKSSFYHCSDLKQLQLPKDLTLMDRAFEDCTGLEILALAGDTVFGSRCFYGCTGIKEIRIQKQWYFISGYESLFDAHLPETVKTIYAGALSCFDIDEDLSLLSYNGNGRSVVIPEGVRYIGSEVFLNNLRLEEIKVPHSVKGIGPRAFHATKWLEDQQADHPLIIVNNILVDAVTAGETVEIPPVSMVAGWAFANCMTLTEVRFTWENTVIGEFAFRNCINLKTIVMADGRSYSLTGIHLRDSDRLPEMVKQIISECYNCFKTDGGMRLIESTGNIAQLNLAGGIISIEDRVFYESNLLSFITLAEETTWIGESAFEQCKWLKQVKNAQNITAIGKKAFSGCGMLEEIALSHKLKEIGPGAFEHCTSLKQIFIPEGVTAIPEKAFYRCKSLTKITLPSTIKTIGKEAFAFCASLKEINLCQGLLSVESRAFAWCPLLNQKSEISERFSEHCFEDSIL